MLWTWTSRRNDDQVMRWQRIGVLTASIVGGLALLGLGLFFVVNGLDRADKFASVIGAFVGLLGLAASVYGVILARREPTRSRSQTVGDSTVGGEVLQVRDV